MLPTPQELRYFQEVAKLKKISRAADTIGVSQPSMSMAIGRLEKKIGQSLFTRHTQGVELTQSGLLLQKEIEGLLHLWRNIMKVAQSDMQCVRGRYSIGAHTSVALGNFENLLPSLIETFPEIEISFEHSFSRLLTQRVLSEELDFGVVVNPCEHPELIIRPLYKDQVTFFVHENHVVPLPTTLIWDPMLLQAQTLLKRLEKSELHVFEKHIETSCLELTANMLVKTNAMAILPKRVATRANNGLIQAFQNIKPYMDHHALIYLAKTSQNKAKKNLARFLETALRNNERGRD